MYRKTLILSLLLCLFASMAYGMGKVPRTSGRAIDFTLIDLNGNAHTLSDYRGKIVFLNFWATWCPPCRAEMPSMQKLYQSWDKEKYVLLAVDIGQDRERVKSFADENGYTFTILLDSQGRIAGKYGIRGIPTTCLIDQQGNLITRIVGSREWSLKEVERIVK